MGEEKVAEAVVSIENQWITIPEPNQKFIIACAVLVIYMIALLIPLLKGDLEMFKIAAAVLSGPVGTVIGYYFGTAK
jgi:hypothetical protein